MINDVDLHDATLLAVSVDWEDGTCTADIRHCTLGLCVLTFSAISHLTLPRKQGWGPSVSIHSFSIASTGRYEIEMQSGDVIEVEAADVVFTPSSRD